MSSGRLLTTTDPAHVVDEGAPLLRVSRRTGLHALTTAQHYQLSALDTLDVTGVAGVALETTLDSAAAFCNNTSR